MVVKHSLAVLRRKGLSVSIFLWYFFLYLQGMDVLGCFHAMWESVQLSLNCFDPHKGNHFLGSHSRL